MRATSAVQGVAGLKELSIELARLLDFQVSIAAVERSKFRKDEAGLS